MTPRRIRALRWAAALAVGATIFQLSGCSVGGLSNFAQSVNPCGTILLCDPVQYRFLTSGYRGPGVDPDIDPACTYPPFCGAADPFTGGFVP